MSDIIGHNEPLVKIACNSCEHFNFEDFKTASCTAFKNIPNEILRGKNMHTKPLKEQKNNIVFEPIKK